LGVFTLAGEVVRGLTVLVAMLSLLNW